MVKNNNKKYSAKFVDIGSSYYFKVTSLDKKTSHEAIVSFKCTCKHHTLFPESKVVCKPMLSVFRKMIKLNKGVK